MKAENRVRADCLLYWSIMGLALALSHPARLFAVDGMTVWAVNDGEKVDRDDLKNSNKQSNSVWDGKKIRLFGARNEVIAFQLIIESGANEVEGLSAKLTGLNRRGGSGKILYAAPLADPAQYTGRPIQIFSVNYMHVESATKADWIYPPGSPSAPRNPLGWKPVQLVPENAKRERGGFPLRIPPRQNQAIWFDIYTGKDLAAGLYEGQVTVVAQGMNSVIPIELELFDFTLPDQNSMHAMVFYTSDQPELYQGKNLDEIYHRFAHRNRVELVYAYSESKVMAGMGRLNGNDFTKTRGYEGPGEGIGNQIVPASFYGPGKGYETRASAWKQSDAWISFLEKTLPGRISFLYMPDEPAPAQFPEIHTIADNIHSNPGPGRRLPVFVTHGFVADLAGAIDIWCSGPEYYQIEKAIQERAQGRDYWIYNGGRPAGGAIVIDAPATDARATIWGCFKHDIKVYFYWHGVHWRHNQQKPGNRIQNVWKNPITFDNRGQPKKPISDQGWANGDGVLMYPGEEKLHPEEDRGIAGPCSTIQLANFRRGLQDHQYLTLARRQGLETLVRETLQTVVPRLFSDAGQYVGFAESGNAFEAARYRLAQAIKSR